MHGMLLTMLSSLTPFLKQKATAHLLAAATTTEIKFLTQMSMLLATKLLIKIPIMLLETSTMFPILIKPLKLLLNLALELELELELELPLTEIACLRLVLFKIF